MVIHLAMAGFSLVLGTGIGKKIIGDEKKRQQTYRQQQAKGAVRRFIDEVAFVLNKETRDVLRTAQRHLRDDFQGRAKQLERSAYEAMEAARRLGGLDEAQLAARERELQARRGSAGVGPGRRPARWRALGSRWTAVADPLVDNLGALLDRAVSSAVSDEARARLVDARERLTGPLRLAIAGKVKAGKSTLLNAHPRRRAGADRRRGVHQDRHLVPRRDLPAGDGLPAGR